MTAIAQRRPRAHKGAAGKTPNGRGSMTVNDMSLRQFMDTQGALPPECTLGYITWFAVEDAPYDAAHLEAEFDRLNLNKSMLPPPLRPDDAFEKATKEIDKFKYDVIGGSTATIMIREVSRDSRQIVRQLTREIKDSSNKVLDYAKVGELVFYKAQTRNGVVDLASARYRATLVNSLSPSERDVLTHVVSLFDAAYIRYRDFHDGQKIRGILRTYLLHLNGVQMKPSVYFVHAERVEELKRLQEFANGLQTTSLLLLPQPDLQELREEVVEVFQKESAKELAAVVAEIQKIREGGKVTPAAYLRLREEYDRVIAKATEYSRTLQISQDTTSGAAEVAHMQLLQLQNDLTGA